MRFEFATAARIVFGPGTLAAVPGLAAGFGGTALLVSGQRPEPAAALDRSLRKSGVTSIPFPLAGEPTTHDIAEGVARARAGHCDLVIGLGGGSVLDAAKAIAALMVRDTPLEEHLEVVGRGLPLEGAAAPCVAVPTTAGTGAEVTRNAVLRSPEHRVKISLRGSALLPRAAVVDPELTYGLPPDITATTGMDALTQLIEAFLCNAPSPLTDALCREGLVRSARALRRAYEHGSDPAAREDLSLASLFSGLTLANARLGAVHGFAGPLGGRYGAPHGALCARLLPFVFEANWQALRERAPGSEALGRFAELGRLVSGRATASAEDGLRWIHELGQALHIRPLRAWGAAEADFTALVAAARTSSSMKGNPIELTEPELMGILRRAL